MTDRRDPLPRRRRIVVAGIVSAGLLASAGSAPGPLDATPTPAAAAGPAPGDGAFELIPPKAPAGEPTTSPPAKPPSAPATPTPPATTTPTHPPPTTTTPPAQPPATTTPAEPPSDTPTTPAADPPATPIRDPDPPASGPDEPASTTSAPAAPSAPSSTTAQRAPSSRAPEEQVTLPELPTTPLARPRLPGVHDAKRQARRPKATDDVPADPPIDGFELGPVTVGLPSFFIDTFAVPPFLLPIYQAAGIEYGVRWEILAAINEIETDYGRNAGVSSAGAVGWMQFLPSTFKIYGVDGNGDGRKDPANPVDAIFSAARYLRAAGAERDLRAAIFAYNHADWYVDDVLKRAQTLAALPADLVAALSGLTQNRSPVLGRAQPSPHAAAQEREPTLTLRTRPRAAVVAVADGEVIRVEDDPQAGGSVTLRDVFGNMYKYQGLGRLAARYPTLAREQAPPTTPTPLMPADDAPPTIPASNASPPAADQSSPTPPEGPSVSPAPPAGPKQRAAVQPNTGARPAIGAPAVFDGVAVSLGRTDWALVAQELAAAAAPQPSRSRRPEPLEDYDRRLLGVRSTADVRYRALRPGAHVVAGTILARAGRATDGDTDGQIRFEVTPAGRGAPRLDPRPIVAGWKLLQSSARRFPRLGGPEPTIGQVMLLGKRALQQRVLQDRRIKLKPCGRDDIRSGRIDRRVLVTLELLAVSNLRPTVSSLRCDHNRLTTTGNVSQHSTGGGVDISAINDIPILGNQGPGSITETAIRRLWMLQGTMKPDQIISLLTVDGIDNTVAMADHADHIHVGFAPSGQQPSITTGISDGMLEPGAWRRLDSRLGEIENPSVTTVPSRYSRPAPPAAP